MTNNETHINRDEVLFKDYKTNFIHFYYNEVKAHPIFDEMRNTVEDSPWHRERNVAIHTDMVVSQYISSAGDVWTKADLLGALACAFHDFGKPDAEETRYSEERGEYRRYTGHELLSARHWETFAVENDGILKELFDFEMDDIYRVGWVIEHHLPFGIKKHHKLQALRNTIDQTVGMKVFSNCLMADCRGRMSDDHQQKIMDSINWINEFITKTDDALDRLNVDYEDSDVAGDGLEESFIPTLHVLVGASGSGKSTYVKKLQYHNGDINVFSLDQIRLDHYCPEELTGTQEGYQAAWEAANNDNKFNSKCNDIYNQMLNERKDIVVDNVNSSVKSRNKFIIAARSKGYNVVGVLFPNTLTTILERQFIRPDKCVPAAAVTDQYKRIHYPSIGEVDKVKVIRTY